MPQSGIRAAIIADASFSSRTGHNELIVSKYTDGTVYKLHEDEAGTLICPCPGCKHYGPQCGGGAGCKHIRFIKPIRKLLNAD